jgi:subtilisin family serine protease
VDPDHPDLQGVINESKNFTSGPSQDIKGHGTHVTGIIAALSNNKVGISGVCQSRKIISLKALGPYDGPGYYRAIRHATDQGAQVINFSLGGNHDPTEELLIKRALDKGVIIVAAMGNGFPQANAPSYPAAIDGVIAVGASTEVDRRASFSQTGKHISLVAPGANIVSTVPTYPSELSETTDYDSWPGTSMATPFVTAAVALLLARNSKATRAKVVSAIIKGADKIGGATGFSEELGHGRLNIRRSLAAL